ncbi:MAG: hypothetical protein L0Y80_04860 [Ignavibacteriae bacterium]|nr:hypothetical protein [Ignavibacteriota bacterium]
MVRKLAVAWIAGMFVLLVGCEQINDPASGLSSEDIADLEEAILSDPMFTSDAVILNDEDAGSINGVLRKSATPIIPVHWGRKIDNFTRNIEFVLENDTTVLATITLSWEGTLYIVAKYSAEDTTRTVIEKPVNEQVQRKIRFYRVANSSVDDDSTVTRRGWRPAEVSGVDGGSTVDSQIDITQMEIIYGDTTITITDPLAYFFELPGKWRHKDRPLICSFGDQQDVTVRVTIESADPDTDWVHIHRPWWPALAGGHPYFKPRHDRMTLVSETPSGSGFTRVYEISWETFLRGRHTFFVSAVTRSTLFDDAAPVSTQIWGVPYIAN